MATEKNYTVEDVEQSFGGLITAMNVKHIYTPEKEAFVKECLAVASKYIEKVGTGIYGYTGLRISDDLAILMLICGGDPQNRIITKVHALRESAIGREYAPEEIVVYFGANNFAKMICDTLDNSRAIREKIRKEDDHIDNYMKDRVAKAKSELANVVGPSN